MINNHQQGFNIIEMMVGLTIGLLGLLAVTQVFISFNQQRNTTTQTMEAQSNGAMALFLMERDLSQAGFALMSMKDCTEIHWYWNPPIEPPATTAPCDNPPDGECGLQDPLTRGVSPLLITHDPLTGSDKLSAQYGMSESGAAGAKIIKAQADFTEPFKLSTTAGFKEGDAVVANVKTIVAGKEVHNCTMYKITKVNDHTAAVAADIFTVEHDFINRPADDYEDYNPSADPSDPVGPPVNIGWKPANIGDYLANMGGYVSKEYYLDGTNLMLEAFPANRVEKVAEGIVYMRAQYGLDTEADKADYVNANGTANEGDGSVDKWTDSLADITTNAPITTDTRIFYNRILAVRVGLVARSPLLEKDEVDAPTTLVVLPEANNPDGDEETYTIPAGTDRHYRYKAYYTIVPFRNVIYDQIQH